MFEWKTEYSLGIHTIDGQHQVLFRLAGELRESILSKSSPPDMGKIIDRLVQYVQVHFAYEERLMRAVEYPDLPAHQLEHEALTRRVEQLLDAFREGHCPITIRLLKLLKDWLEDHIMGSDPKYVPYVKKTPLA